MKMKMMEIERKLLEVAIWKKRSEIVVVADG